MYYLLFYRTVENYIEKRAPFRSEHLALAQKAYDNSFLIMGGALADPVDTAILLFKTDNPGEIEEFVSSDPYVKNGLITGWSIRPWTVVIGNK